METSSRLDLHGVKHQDVDMSVENFVLMNQNNFPLTIVCGNSIRMINLAETVLKRIGCEYKMYRFGVLTIGRFK
jgi:hypothetical protein